MAHAFLQNLCQLFSEADIDRSGSLSTEELSTLLKTYYKLEGLARPLVKVQDEVCAAIDGYDADGSGSLELPEFIAMVCEGEAFHFKVEAETKRQALEMMQTTTVLIRCFVEAFDEADMQRRGALDPTQLANVIRVLYANSDRTENLEAAQEALVLGSSFGQMFRPHEVLSVCASADILPCAPESVQCIQLIVGYAAGLLRRLDMKAIARKRGVRFADDQGLELCAVGDAASEKSWRVATKKKIPMSAKNPKQPMKSGPSGLAAVVDLLSNRAPKRRSAMEINKELRIKAMQDEKGAVEEGESALGSYPMVSLDEAASDNACGAAEGALVLWGIPIEQGRIATIKMVEDDI